MGIATTKVLNAFGFDVEIANVGCCQRPKLSNGFLKDAKIAGGRTVRNLTPFLETENPILVCEPSCASALHHDLPDLLDDENLESRLQDKIKTVATFLKEQIEQGAYK